MRISRTKRRISASSMRAVERRRSRKLLGKADIMLLLWKPVDTCKGAWDRMPRNTGPPGSSEEMEKQTAGAGSRASIFKHLLVQLPPVLHRRQLWGTLQHLLRRPAQISVAEQMGTVSRDIKLLKASQRMSTGGEQEAREYLNLKFQPIKAYTVNVHHKRTSSGAWTATKKRRDSGRTYSWADELEPTDIVTVREHT